MDISVTVESAYSGAQVSAPADRHPSVGIQSIEVGMPLLKVLTRASGALSLTALADAAAMPRGKAHKYLASYVRSGLVVQKGAGGHYDLGPFALDLGVAAMRRLNVMELAQLALDHLRDQLGMTVSLAVWANRGPALVRGATPYTSNGGRLGTVFPVLGSTAGQVFAAFLDRKHTQAAITAELADPDSVAVRSGLNSLAQVETLLAGVRERRMATAPSLVVPTMATLAAPIFDQNNAIIATMAVVGIKGQIDLAWEGREARALAAESQALSRRLGATSY